MKESLLQQQPRYLPLNTMHVEVVPQVLIAMATPDDIDHQIHAEKSFRNPFDGWTAIIILSLTGLLTIVVLGISCYLCCHSCKPAPAANADHPVRIGSPVGNAYVSRSYFYSKTHDEDTESMTGQPPLPLINYTKRAMRAVGIPLKKSPVTPFEPEIPASVTPLTTFKPTTETAPDNKNK